MTFQTFTSLLKGKTNQPSKYYKIGSKNHRVSKFLQKKATLVSAFDDKRWMYDCMIHSLPYGSFYARKKNSKSCPFCKKIKNVWPFPEFFVVFLDQNSKINIRIWNYTPKARYLLNLIIR